jgi:polyhydroxybutyrate depolymerase
MKFLWICLGLLLLPGNTTLAETATPAELSSTAGAGATAGATLYRIRSGGIFRWYRVHYPPTFDAQSPTPVVVAFHGGGGNAIQFMQQTELNDASNLHGFVVVYPEGTGTLGGWPLFSFETWNAGDCCGYASNRQINDVQFARDLITDLDTRMKIDRDALFATGHSNGGMMSYRLAVEAPDLFVAVAPNSASLQLQTRPAVPIPLIAFHGKLDCNVPFQGGMGCGVSGVSMQSQRNSVIPFVQVNQALLPPLNQPSEVRGKALRYEAPSSLGADVFYWWMLDHGHAWPGHGSAINDPVNMDIDANEEIWLFFDQHRR